MIRFDVLTLFPEIFHSPLEESILKRAREASLVQVVLHNLRDWAEGKHKTADDSPFGGGDGMVMKPDLLERAVNAVSADGEKAPVILLSPQGRRFDQNWARSLSRLSRVILVCGRYAGIDQRAVDRLFDCELSIGDYVLSGGELPALAVIEAVSRLCPGVLGNCESAGADSFPARLEASQFTRPRLFGRDDAPETIVGGDHKKVDEWRVRDSLRRTLLRRPDLFLSHAPDEQEMKALDEIKRELIGH
jgi:tRNA (guanine37-N1)-methyltransferase